MAAGLEEFLRNVDIADQRVRDAAVLAVSQFAQVVVGRAQELCPVSPTNATITSPKTGEKIKNPRYTGTSGALRDSGNAQEAVIEGDKIEAKVGFNTRYAAAVHERLDQNHKYPGAVNPEAQAKFLESAINEYAEKFIPYVGARVKAAMAGGGGGT